MDQDVEDRIPGERAEISTSRGVDTNPVLKRGAVAVAIIAFVGFALWSTTGKKGREDNVQPERIVIRQTTPFEAAKEKVEPEQPVPEIKLPTPVEQPVTEEKDEMLDSARRAPVMAFSGGNKNRKDGSESASYYSSDNENFLSLDNKVTVQNQQNNEQDRFDGLLRPTRLEGSRAGTLGNRNFTVAMGTSIPCILETALASDQPGFTTCVINRDVLSDNGRVVLMEKGTQVVGEYRGGLQRGQTRLFILWNRAKTPKGVIVTLASPATDRLGRAGFDGYVDTHWWERFGGALLLSVVGDATNYANSRLRDSDVDAQKTTSASQQAAAIAIEQSINIPPTLNKHQGEPVSIFVARDLDFSGIYSLRVIEPKNRVFDRAALGDFAPRSTLLTK